MTDPLGSPLVSTNRRRPLRILLADDQAPNRLVVQHLLRSLSSSIDVVVNGREALEALEHQEYDVVLMDFLMPEMDGLEATRQIRRNRPEGQRPSVIALTADATPEDRELCRAVGMDDFIAKPLRTSDLIRVLERYRAQTDQDETPGAMIGAGRGRLHPKARHRSRPEPEQVSPSITPRPIARPKTAGDRFALPAPALAMPPLRGRSVSRTRVLRYIS